MRATNAGRSTSCNKITRTIIDVLCEQKQIGTKERSRKETSTTRDRTIQKGNVFDVQQGCNLSVTGNVLTKNSDHTNSFATCSSHIVYGHFVSEGVYQCVRTCVYDGTYSARVYQHPRKRPCACLYACGVRVCTLTRMHA